MMKKATGSFIFTLFVLLLSISIVSSAPKLREMKKKKPKKSKSPKPSPDDFALFANEMVYTRGTIEEQFRLKKGSLVIPSDGKAFEKAIQKSDWSQYSRVGMQLSRSIVLAGNRTNNVGPTNELTILHRHDSGLYYQEIFVGNSFNWVGQVLTVVGISGNQVVACNYFDTTEPPSPLVPKGADDPPCIGPFMSDLNPAACSYNKGDEKLAYDITFGQIIPDQPEISKGFYERFWVSFSDLDVFADRDPKGNEWPQWILDNRDEFYDKGKTSYPCTGKR